MIPEIFMNKLPEKNTQAYMQISMIFQGGSPIQTAMSYIYFKKNGNWGSAIPQRIDRSPP
jgi:hypothetical protein